MKYRAEIDGMRAVAIIPVVLFHAGFRTFSGGYVGVDVFFMISGYLITSLILLESGEGNFSIMRFYERRARRILPALFAMMAACVPFAYFLMLPAQLKRFGEGLVAVTLFLSNLWLFFRSTYFAPSSALNPLLHTWTLSVEEQFYVLFPPFLMLLGPLRRKRIAAGIIAVMVVSFAFAQMGGSLNAHFLFIDRDWAYLTPARAWELMFGSLIAVVFPSGFVRYSILSEVAAVAGLLAILCACVLFREGTVSPSYFMLVPTLGAVFVILFATPSTWVGRLLGHRWLVGIGLISYSIYIWHQPLFAFARLQFGDPPLWVMGGLSLVSVLVGYLGWRYIEQPFRTKGAFTRRQIFTWAALTSSFFLALGVVAIGSQGAAWRFAPQDRYLAGFDPESQGGYVWRRFKDLDAPFNLADRRRRVLVMGDSFAQDFVNMLGENGKLGAVQLSTYYVAPSCQLADQTRCRKLSPFSAVVRTRVTQADVVILEARWSEATARGLPAFVNRLGLSANQRLIVLGTKHFGTITPQAYMALSGKQRLAVRNYGPAMPENAVLKSEFGGNFVNFIFDVCKSDETCPVFTPDGKLISFDGEHLTSDGARYVGSVLLQEPVMTGLFDSGRKDH